MKALSLITVALLAVTGCNKHVSAPVTPPPPQRIREPAVAGAFYPKEEVALTFALDQMLAQAPLHNIPGELRAIICPHAGYQFSGPIAAHAYRLLPGREYETVFVVAASHYAMFNGASVLNADAYRTPLGLVPISPKAKDLAKLSPFVLEPTCMVQRPGFAGQTKPLPPPGEETPETWEHSGEVQVPFLQKTLRNFSLVSIITGDVDPQKMAETLSSQINDKTLLVISTDLSHYHPYEDAKTRDRATVQAMTDLDISRMLLTGDACGKTPVLVALHLAKKYGWKAKLLDYRNSGDTAGNKEGVVGYAAIALYSPEKQMYSTDERKMMLELARGTLRAVVTGQTPAEPKDIPANLQPKKGCFVTLTKNGQLRGCIGHIMPQEALYRAIIDNATSAALHDTRFNPVTSNELAQIEVEISVLTEPAPLTFNSPDDLLSKLHPHKDGVVLQVNGHGATYLPQVWEQIPDKVTFLDSLSQKAGCAPGDWRNPGTRVFIYHVEAFKESEP